MRKYHHPAAYVLGVLAVLATVVLTTPNGATGAQWVDQQSIAAPALAMGRIALEPVPAGSPTTLSNASGFGLEYRPAEVAVRAGAGTTPADVDTLVELTGGLEVSYHPGATECSAGAGAWNGTATGTVRAPLFASGDLRAALPADAPAPELCLAVTPDPTGTESLRSLDGRVFEIVTTLETVPGGTGSWTGTQEWSVPYVVDLPAEQEAPFQAQCEGTDDRRHVRLSWTWTADPAAVVAWRVSARPEGSSSGWTEVARSAGSVQHVELTNSAVGIAKHGPTPNGTYALMVEALDGNGAPIAGADTAQPVGLTGNTKFIECTGTN